MKERVKMQYILRLYLFKIVVLSQQELFRKGYVIYLKKLLVVSTVMIKLG